jgi:hypothetical protein
VNRVDTPEAEDAEFLRWYGAWAPLDPGGLAALMDGFDRPWWVVGGWSLQAFTGVPREHADIDLSFLSRDVPAFRAHLRTGWTPWSNDGGTLRPLSDRWPATPHPDSQIWVRRDAASPWVLDAPVTPDADGLWTNKRWSAHVCPVEEATWVAEDGIRYLRPEIALHFKARQRREKDVHDLDAAWPLLSADARAWLLTAIRETEGPDHPWLGRLAI